MVVRLDPDDGIDAEVLMRAADVAMYHAKGKGRGNYQFFTPALNAAAQHRLLLGNQLRQALTRGEFSLHYQPQVDISSGRIFAAEALLRWQRPERGFMSRPSSVDRWRADTYPSAWNTRRRYAATTGRGAV